jgi:4-amino-4-deoxy-L-arabinose transferase-like glycosyltransferase
MQEEISYTTKTKAIIICGVLVLAAVNAFWMLSAKTLDSHECFVSVTAREMVQDGHWLIPTCNGEVRLNKTPLSYWLVACVAKITGKVDEFSARLPSVIFGILSVAAILYFLSRWLSFRTAAISASVWATTFGYIRCSQNARPDMALTFFVILCFLSFYSATITQERKEQIVYFLVFWISFALGMLAKGPAPLAYVSIPIVCHIVFSRNWKMIPKMLPLTGIIIFLAIVLPWPLFVANKLNWDLLLWKHEYIDRLTGEYAPGNYPVYYYFLMMFKFITPWVVFLPMSLAAPFYRVWEKKRAVMIYLAFWFVCNFIFLTIDAGKRQHYIMPLMPAAAILTGIILDDIVFERKAYTLKFARNILRCHFLIITSGIMTASIYICVRQGVFCGAMIFLAIITIAMITAVAVLFSRRKPAAALSVIFSGIVIWSMASKAIFGTVLDENRFSRDFAERAAEIVPPSGRLVAYKHLSSRFVQYFGRIVPEISEISQIEKDYEQGAWVICDFTYLEELLQGSHFRVIYSDTLEPGENKDDMGGDIFHKTAAIVDDSNSSDVREVFSFPEKE